MVSTTLNIVWKNMPMLIGTAILQVSWEIGSVVSESGSAIS
jgi:hypothetical protein